MTFLCYHAHAESRCTQACQLATRFEVGPSDKKCRKGHSNLFTVNNKDGKNRNSEAIVVLLWDKDLTSQEILTKNYVFLQTKKRFDNLCWHRPPHPKKIPGQNTIFRETHPNSFSRSRLKNIVLFLGGKTFSRGKVFHRGWGGVVLIETRSP